MSSEVKEIFSQTGGGVSFMRVASGVMLVVAIIFLFLRVNMDTLNWPGLALIALLFGFAFFPKAIQKKYEQFNLHTRKDTQENTL